MVLKNEQHRIKALLTEAITVLCKNGLGYHYNFTIEGLLGITLDDEDIFLVNIKETIKKADRPPPEPPKSPSPEPPARSPGGPSRRRRRRSDNDYPNSPPKRAAMGSDVPRDSEDSGDVIVIKEEVTDSEVAAEFYGDSGGGFDQMQPEPQYMQGDPGAPGCSQWDQDQAASWQATAAQSFAASSSMLSTSMSSPSQIQSDVILPAPQLRSLPIRQVFTEKLAGPVLESNWKVCAFRMGWSGRDSAASDVIKERLVELREELDNVVYDLPGVLFFVSALTATKSSVSKKTSSSSHYHVHPAVGYWVVSAPDVAFDQRRLFMTMQENRLSANLKLLVQPYQREAKHIINSLQLVVKDAMEGCVPRMVQTSALHCLGDKGHNYPIIKFHVRESETIKILAPVKDELSMNGLQIEIVTR